MENINKSLRKMCQMEQWRSKGWKAVQVKYGINIIKEAKDERHNLSHYTRLNSISVILHKELYHLWFSHAIEFENLLKLFSVCSLWKYFIVESPPHIHTPLISFETMECCKLFSFHLCRCLFMFNQLQIEKPLIHKIDSSIPFYMPRISIGNIFMMTH